MRPTASRERFVFDLRRKRFIDLATGKVAQRKDIEAACGLIDVDGRMVSSADWVRLCRSFNCKLTESAGAEAWQKAAIISGLKVASV